MIDLHAHLLPKLDDGSRSLDQSSDVLSLFVSHGITDVVMTPHLQASRIVNGGEEAIELRDRALVGLRSAAPHGVRLHPGFEIMLDIPFPELAMGDRRYSVAESRYYLVEFPYAIVGDLACGILARIAQAGVIPLVAHPERYTTCSVATVTAWRDAGARIQVDATTVTRPSTRGQRARALLGAGLIDVLAADNHGDRRHMGTAVDFLAARDASEVGELLTSTNPRAVLADEGMVPVPATRVRERLREKVKRWLAP